eukprot:TRINITY_DN2797_c0_g3_i1.p1 TRINITY_DN2797_c0_g3~~TRINITY_DN2797_c0_g3_i1.p1  ORF type:complete len:621 (+),score=67.82 TRINITY_DN2797_c0_g3_i1:71-1864(+)
MVYRKLRFAVATICLSTAVSVELTDREASCSAGDAEKCAAVSKALLQTVSHNSLTKIRSDPVGESTLLEAGQKANKAEADHQAFAESLEAAYYKRLSLSEMASELSKVFRGEPAADEPLSKPLPVPFDVQLVGYVLLGVQVLNVFFNSQLEQKAKMRPKGTSADEIAQIEKAEKEEEILMRMAGTGYKCEWIHYFILMQAAALYVTSQDVMIPNMPRMAHELATTPAKMALTLQCNWLVAGIMNVFVCTLSDYVGRRPVILVGMQFYMVGTLITALAPTVTVAIVGRTIQGIGEATCSLIAAIARDLITDPEERVKLFAMIGILTAVGVILAPVVGGIIGAIVGWRMIFSGLAVWGIALYYQVGRYLPESHPKFAAFRSSSRSLDSPVLSFFKTMTKGSHGIAFLCFSSLQVPAIMSAYSNLTFMLHKYHGFGTADIGRWFLGCALLIIICAVITTELILRKKTSAFYTLQCSMAWFLVTSVIFLTLGSLVPWGEPAPSFLYCAGPVVSAHVAFGIASGPFNSYSMQPFGESAGVAAGVLRAVEAVCSAVIAFTMAHAIESGGEKVFLLMSGGIMLLANVLWWPLMGFRRPEALKET